MNFFELFFLTMTQRIEPSFQKWLRKLNFLWEMSQRIECDSKNCFFFEKIIQILELFFLSQRIEYDSKNCFFFGKNHSNYWTFLRLKELSPVKNLTQELFFSKTWLKELNFVSKKDSKNLTSFYMTQRIELFFCCDSKNWTSFLYESKNWTFLWMWLK